LRKFSRSVKKAEFYAELITVDKWAQLLLAVISQKLLPTVIKAENSIFPSLNVDDFLWRF
jgi:hypothetical protein